MPTYTKGRPYADKENFDVDGQGPRARRPSEKQRLLTSEQQELVQRREIRAQRERKRDRLRKLAEAGSENGGSDGVADDDLSVDDDNDDDGDNGTQEIHQPYRRD
ncbi:hypothetical protein EDD15DRAFT_2380975 [Pisolithus albus]|nr:hypothetical protein EDD15DRAFT_2380975 [Pisolithus albus]